MMLMLRVMTYVVSDKLFQIINCFGIELLLYDLYLTMFDLTKRLLFDNFFLAVFYQLSCCDHCLYSNQFQD